MSSPLTAETNREEWLAARRKGIGASEIAAVLGISPWESPFSLYWRKVNGWDYEPSAEMEWGTRLERVIADKYADAHPDEILLPGSLMVGITPWQLATPDRIIACETPEDFRCWRVPADEPLRPTPMAVLELKTARSADGWGEPGGEEIPVYYRAQVQWQMDVVDVQYAVVAVLIGGSEYREYTVPRDDKDIAVMIEAGRRFMHRIETGDPPPIDDHQATLATVKRLHPDLDDETVEVDERTAQGYARAVAMARKADALKTRYEIALRAQMGHARKATSGGTFIASRSIFEVAETTRKAYTVDRLNPAREHKK